MSLLEECLFSFCDAQISQVIVNRVLVMKIIMTNWEVVVNPFVCATAVWLKKQPLSSFWEMFDVVMMDDVNQLIVMSP